MYNKRRRMFITMTMVLALSGLTGCGKGTEDTDRPVSFGVETEELPVPEEMESGEEPKVQEPQEPSGTEEEDFSGDIVEIGEGQFTVIEIYLEELEDGGEIMVASAEGSDEEKEAPRITVTYDENTKFIRQKIWDAGAGHEETEGTADDLETGLTAHMKGRFEGEVFHAAEVMVVEVIQD